MQDLKLKKEEDLVKNEQEKFNFFLLYDTYKNIKMLNQLPFNQHNHTSIVFNRKKNVEPCHFFDVSQFLYANTLLTEDKKQNILKKYFVFLLINANKILKKNHSKKYLVQQKLKKIRYQMKKKIQIEKNYFFSQRIIFYYFKNLYPIRGVKKKQPILNKQKREKYINRLLTLIQRKLSLSELFYEKQAKQKMRKIKDFSSKLGILHYVTTTRNLKVTFTNAKNRVLFYMSSGHKKCKKAQRKKFFAKKELNDEMIARVYEMGYKRVIIVYHGRIGRTSFLKKLFKNIGIKIIKRIYKINSPHNGCRQKRRR